MSKAEDRGAPAPGPDGARLRAVLAQLDAMHRWRGWVWQPGADPFEIIVGAILVQNTAWTNVERALALPHEERVVRVLVHGVDPERPRRERTCHAAAPHIGGLDEAEERERAAQNRHPAVHAIEGAPEADVADGEPGPADEKPPPVATQALKVGAPFSATSLEVISTLPFFFSSVSAGSQTKPPSRSPRL